MNNERFHRLLLSVLFSMMLASSQPAGKYSLAGLGEGWATAIQPAPTPPSIKSAGPLEKEKLSSDSQTDNLFKLVIINQDMFEWRTPKGFKVPPQLCEVFKVCPTQSGLPAKLWATPATDEKGHEDGMGIVASSTNGDLNHPDIVILSHTSETGWEAFLVSVDGTLGEAAYKETKNSSWKPAPKSMADLRFNQDKEWWLKWLREHHAKGI